MKARLNMKRYAVFFMTHHSIVDAREVTNETTETTVIVPIDTQFFLFTQTENDLRCVKRNFEQYKYSVDFDTFIDYTFGLPIENETLYFIGEDNGYKIYNSRNNSYFPSVAVRNWGYKIKVIDPQKINHQKLKNLHKTEKNYFTYRKGDRLSSNYIVTLEPSGMVSSSSWNQENGENNSVFYHYNSLISNIKTVAADHPELYQAIIDHVDETDHIYFKKLADFCRIQIGKKVDNDLDLFW